jgi:hypothetical protein
MVLLPQHGDGTATRPHSNDSLPRPSSVRLYHPQPRKTTPNPQSVDVSTALVRPPTRGTAAGTPPKRNPSLTVSDSELETLRIQFNKANYEASNLRADAERTKLRYEGMLRDRDTQIQQEQKNSADLQKDRKFLFEKQQSQATELLTIQDDYANYKVPNQQFSRLFFSCGGWC